MITIRKQSDNDPVATIDAADIPPSTLFYGDVGKHYNGLFLMVGSPTCKTLFLLTPNDKGEIRHYWTTIGGGPPVTIKQRVDATIITTPTKEERW